MKKGNEIKHYTILEKVGFGGMATVYNGFDPKRNELVAIKILSEQYSLESNYVKRFNKEADILRRLVHPNIVGLVDAGVENGMHYIVMEYVKGKAISDVIEENGPYQVETACKIIIQVASALKFAHQQQIIHRDIKPHNIMLDKDGDAKVLDFGIARLEGAESLTQTGAMIGTLNYVSPEQVKGQMIDQRSDIFSLGATLYEMVTGTVPIKGKSQIEVVMAHMQGEIKIPSQYNPAIPRVLDIIIMKMLAKDPKERYQNCGQVVEDLDKFLKGELTDEELETRVETGAVDIAFEDLDPVQQKIRLGQQYFKENKIYNALSEFRKAIEMNPEEADIHYELGIVLWQADMTADAIECMEKVLELNPEHVEAKIYIDKYYNRREQSYAGDSKAEVMSEGPPKIDPRFIQLDPYNDPSLIVGLSLLLPGTGHLMVGRTIKGVATLLMLALLASGWYYKPVIQKNLAKPGSISPQVEHYFGQFFDLSTPRARQKAYDLILKGYSGVFGLVYVMGLFTPYSMARKKNLSGYIVEIVENNYITINIGMLRGIEVDMKFNVFKNPIGIESAQHLNVEIKQIGKCTITETFEQSSRAKFEPLADTYFYPALGDKVIIA